jgi:hypothetical protein
MKYKLRLIYIPYLIIGMSIIVGLLSGFILGFLIERLDKTDILSIHRKHAGSNMY